MNYVREIYAFIANTIIHTIRVIVNTSVMETIASIWITAVILKTHVLLAMVLGALLTLFYTDMAFTVLLMLVCNVIATPDLVTCVFLGISIAASVVRTILIINNY